MNVRLVLRRAGRSSAMIAVLTLSASCDAPTAARPAFAYDPTTLSRGILYRWPSGRVINVWTAEDNAGAATSLSAAVRQAIVAWNAVPTFGEFTLAVTARIAEANIIVYDRATALPVVPASCGFDPQGAAGYTYLCAETARPTVAQQFVLTSGEAGVASVVIRVDRGRVADQAAYARLVMHELGHALGIGGHSDMATDVMFGAPLVNAPSAADVRTLRYLLGRRPDLTL